MCPTFFTKAASGVKLREATADTTSLTKVYSAKRKDRIFRVTLPQVLFNLRRIGMATKAPDSNSSPRSIH